MKLYAGRLHLQESAIIRLKVIDAYSIHRIILDLILPQRDVDKVRKGNTSSGVQWVDQGEHLFGRRIDFISNISPSKVGDCGDFTIECRELPDDFLNHKVYRFQTVVNPVRFSNGKREPIKYESDIAQWFSEKMKRSGADVNNIIVDKICTEKFYKSEGDKTRRIVFRKARVSGFLTVIDHELFKNMIINGFGKGRAFGYGFVQLAIAK